LLFDFNWVSFGWTVTVGTGSEPGGSSPPAGYLEEVNMAATAVEYGLLAAVIIVAGIGFTTLMVLSDPEQSTVESASVAEQAIESTSTIISILTCEGPGDEIKRFTPGKVTINRAGTWGKFQDGRSFEYSPSVKCYLEDEIVENSVDD